MGVLGGLIDVRPKVLHNNVPGQDVRKSVGKARDNIQTVIGTEKIMIQSKPRGGNDQAQIESHPSKIPTNRSRAKKQSLLSTQPKTHDDAKNNAMLKSTDCVDDLNNEAANLNGSDKDDDRQNDIASFEQFETDSNYR